MASGLSPVYCSSACNEQTNAGSTWAPTTVFYASLSTAGCKKEIPGPPRICKMTVKQPPNSKCHCFHCELQICLEKR